MNQQYNIQQIEGHLGYWQQNNNTSKGITQVLQEKPEILFITTYPSRECGIATYSQDLIHALTQKFGNTFQFSVCALEAGDMHLEYPSIVKYTLNTDDTDHFNIATSNINNNKNISVVVIQHEFGLFANNEGMFIEMLHNIHKPKMVVFHTVLPSPDPWMRLNVRSIAQAAQCIIVMTHDAKAILAADYQLSKDKIAVVPHGTHLVIHANKVRLKEKYKLMGRNVLSTFGLISSGKSLETTLDALPAIIAQDPTVLFLIIGKTHPSIVKNEGETYRDMLVAKVKDLNLGQHVQFINKFLPLDVLLEYLQLTDVYIFTSNNPNQAVSGTFAYAISCGCPIVSTPIAHAREYLQNEVGLTIDFNNSVQLSDAVNELLQDEQKRNNMVHNGLHQMAATAWENAAIAHALLLKKNILAPIKLNYSIPTVNLSHLKKMTTEIGMIQFSKLDLPDLQSGYTLDDNARALIACCQYFELTGENEILESISTYLSFIKFCQQKNGLFLNYVDQDKNFTFQNYITNLEDSNGRAFWALGYLISLGNILPQNMVNDAEDIFWKTLPNVMSMHSTRAIAFNIKGLYYYNQYKADACCSALITVLANRLVQMYRHEGGDQWFWYESYLTYGNSLLPEAMLCAYLSTNDPLHLEIAHRSFEFLLSKIFYGSKIKAISNRQWMSKDNVHLTSEDGGEQPIEIAYTILALDKFIEVYDSPYYKELMNVAFSWFLGNNHICQIVYNPCTGGCYDGVEKSSVNLNQGAESTLSYLISRLIIAKHSNYKTKVLCLS